MQANEEEY